MYKNRKIYSPNKNVYKSCIKNQNHKTKSEITNFSIHKIKILYLCD